MDGGKLISVIIPTIMFRLFLPLSFTPFPSFASFIFFSNPLLSAFQSRQKEIQRLERSRSQTANANIVFPWFSGFSSLTNARGQYGAGEKTFENVSYVLFLPNACR